MSSSTQPKRLLSARRTARQLLGLVVLVGLIAACAPIQVPVQPASPLASESPLATPLSAEEQALQDRFRAAVVDASVAEPAEIYDGLTAILPDNPALVWSEDGSKVLMATWTSWNGYDNAVGTEMVLTRETWVTAAPEFQTFCQTYPAQAATPLVLRLEQLLGLPPHNGKTKIVEMWVPADGLFRPSPDPEIDDQVAELELRDASTFASQTDYEQHRDWYNLQNSLSYDPVNGYPWTRLGYSYDWGNPESEIGLSEFVIWAQTPVIIEQVYTNQAYCNPR